MQLSELLQWLSTGLKTGTLVVRGAPGEKRIYFQQRPGHVLLVHARARVPGPLPRRLRLHHRGGAHPRARGPAGVEDPPREDPRHDRRHQGGGARGPRPPEGRRDDLRHLPVGPRARSRSSTARSRASRWSRSPPTSRASSWRACAATTSGSASGRAIPSHARQFPSVRHPGRGGAERAREDDPRARSNGRRAIDQIALETHNPDFHVAKLDLRPHAQRATCSSWASGRRTAAEPGVRRGRAGREDSSSFDPLMSGDLRSIPSAVAPRRPTISTCSLARAPDARPDHVQPFLEAAAPGVAARRRAATARRPA